MHGLLEAIEAGEVVQIAAAAASAGAPPGSVVRAAEERGRGRADLLSLWSPGRYGPRMIELMEFVLRYGPSSSACSSGAELSRTS